MTIDSSAELAQRRVGIDAAQHDMWAALGERFRETRAVGELKAAAGLPVVDPAREAQILEDAAVAAREYGIHPDLARLITRAIINRVVVEHEALARGVDPSTLPDYPYPSALGPEPSA